MKLLDTSTLIDFLRGDPGTIEHLRAARPGDLATSSIVVDELYAGAAGASDSQRELFRIDLLLRPLRILDVDARSARTSGLLRTLLERSGAGIGVADRLIAATALTHGIPVVTSNTREFIRVPGLVTENWRAS